MTLTCGLIGDGCACIPKHLTQADCLVEIEEISTSVVNYDADLWCDGVVLQATVHAEHKSECYGPPRELGRALDRLANPALFPIGPSRGQDVFLTKREIP